MGNTFRFSFHPLDLATLPAVPKDRQTWPLGAFPRTTPAGNRVLWLDYREGGRYLSANVLEEYRQVGDPELDALLEMMEEEGRPLQSGEDLFDRFAERNDEHEPPSQRVLRRFVERYQQTPSWVDWKEIQKGQEVFLAYAFAMAVSLFYRSLIPGFSISKMAAVLLSTGYLAPPSSRQRVVDRLVDTGAFLAACCSSCLPEDEDEKKKKKKKKKKDEDKKDGSRQNDEDNKTREAAARRLETLFPGGAGWKAALQVRVLHAKVRRALLQRKRPVWNVEELGVPINQEDMAATLLAFSTNALWGCEMIAGVPLPLDERQAYLSFWRYLGWLLGVGTTEDDHKMARLQPLDPCGPGWDTHRPNAHEHSSGLLISIVCHLMQPDARSIRVAHHLIRLGIKEDDDEDGWDMWSYFRALRCRHFVGNTLADALQLPRHPVWYRRYFLWTVSTIYLCVLRLYTWAAWPGSPFRRHLVRWHGQQVQKHLSRWKEPHLKRMRGDEETSNSTEALQKESPWPKDRAKTQKTPLGCPFAMVSPPSFPTDGVKERNGKETTRSNS